MPFGVGKLPGVNNTHKRNMQKLVDQGYVPQEISDKLDVNLRTILSFFPIMSKGEVDMSQYSTVDISIASNQEALATASRIVEDAKAEAAAIKAEAIAPVAKLGTKKAKAEDD